MHTTVCDKQTACMYHRTLKPARSACHSSQRKFQHACFQKIRNTHKKQQSVFQRVFVRMVSMPGLRGGGGAVSLAAVSVLMEREGACRILCVSSLHVRDIAWRKCITGRCPKAPSTPLPSLLPLSLPGLSSSFVSEHREHREPFKTATGKHIWSRCNQGHCSSSTLTNTTMVLLAWKKRWFILRSGRMSGDPDVLEYYKNDHSKKPIRVIDLHCCEQVDAGLTFKRKEFQDSFVFDIKTSDRTFYLVAETEEEMNKWVRSICQLCGFNQSDDNHERQSFVLCVKSRLTETTKEEPARTIVKLWFRCPFNRGCKRDGRLHHMPRSVGADVTGSMAPLTGERKSSAPIHSSQPVLFTFDVPRAPGLPPATPVHEQEDRECTVKVTTLRRPVSGFLLSVIAGLDSLGVELPSQPHDLHINLLRWNLGETQEIKAHRLYAEIPVAFSTSFCSVGLLIKTGIWRWASPSQENTSYQVHDDSSQEACYVLPRGYSTEAPAHSGLGEPDLENEEVYTFKTPCNTLATMHSNERPTDNYDLPTPPGSFYQIPRTFDKNHNALTPSSSESSCAPPPRPPKPSQGSEGQWGSPHSVGSQNGDMTSAEFMAVVNIDFTHTYFFPLNTGSSFETNSHHRPIHFNNSGQSVESVNDGFSSYLRTKAPLTRSDSGNSDDNYVPMNPGSSPLSAAQADSPKNIYIPMSPGPHHFDFPGFSATLPARKGSSASLCHRPGRLSDVTPPPINRNLKPNRKSKPTPLDLKNNGIIDELPFKSPVTMSWTRPMPAMNSVSSQHCRPISTQSITSTDSADSEENYVAMPSTSSVTSDEKVDYVQVDQEKTQALQSTMQEWTDVRQSTEPAKGVKS
ncbi:GRB2-associated-binding protein 2 GRB2-associated binder 2 [Collichthys lucidus]|uniref:GRB2-associated-binding protein 2 GRB2-associated binder 2 n=1 Tax=Collichthys lucidus TaxID=240159 RepID=A0A4U5V0P0_COLLU|nr:GRB2-associated-binding protein 2 GRB2-associated binder 2 [Collichthys lucidus]